MPDSARLQAELERIQRALASVAAGPRGAGLIDDLRGALGGAAEEVLWQALYADCLRLIHSAVAADGDISDAEIDAFHGIVAAAASHYATTGHAQYGEFASIENRRARFSTAMPRIEVRSAKAHDFTGPVSCCAAAPTSSGRERRWSVTSRP